MFNSNQFRCFPTRPSSLLFGHFTFTGALYEIFHDRIVVRNLEEFFEWRVPGKAH